jgi:hypothetical protein
MGAAAAAVVAGAAASVVAVMPGLLAAEDAVASVVVAVAAGAVAAGSMPSGSVISRPPAADPGEDAACAKSHDLTARLSRLRVIFRHGGGAAAVGPLCPQNRTLGVVTAKSAKGQKLTWCWLGVCRHNAGAPRSGSPAPAPSLSMSKRSGRSHRYELVLGEDVDFVASQRDTGNGRWQTVSAWMVPSADHR